MNILSNVKKGSRVRIKSLHEGFEAKSTLTGIGILPGDEVEVISNSFLGSPVAISFGDNEFLAMRVHQAKMVEVEDLIS